VILLNKRTREEVRSVIWFMWVSNTRAMHISRHCGHVWGRCDICPATSVQLVLWLCKWSGVMDEIRSGSPSTSNMYINDDEMVLADVCIVEAGTHPLTTQCLG